MRPAFVTGAVFAGTAALAHLLFALANLGLAGDEEAFGSLVLPLLAGATALVSGRQRFRSESREGARPTRPTDSPA